MQTTLSSVESFHRERTVFFMLRIIRVMRGTGKARSCRHFRLLWMWVLYFALYLLAENLVTDGYRVSYLPADDVIPFLPVFVIPYCLWYPMLGAMSLYLAHRDADTFRKYMLSVALGFFPVLIFCMLFPNGQELRPDVFPQENLLTRWVALIYAADTNTNVLPSMHVIGCCLLTAAAFACEKLHRQKLHLVILPLCILTAASTLFIKQHSVLDVLTALPYSALVLLLVYRRPHKK